MKKLFIVMMLVAAIGLMANDSIEIKQPTNHVPVRLNINGSSLTNQTTQRNVPDYEFSRAPMELGITNFYDYMPGSYNSTPIRLQPAADGGLYMGYSARETAEATRRAWYAYIDDAGEVYINDRISTVERHEGFVGIDIDPISGNPITAWHRLMDNNIDWAVVYTYDVYSMMNEPGLWLQPIEMIDPVTAQHPNPEFAGCEFIWPYAFIGPSPEPDKRRVYITANNSSENPVTDGPSENPIIAYADFDENDLLGQTPLDWSYTSIPEADQWHLQGLRRPIMSMAVSEEDGKVAFFGYNIVLDGDANANALDEEMFVFVNHNYGEGEWVKHSRDAYFEIGMEIPYHLDGTSPFALEPDEMICWGLINSNHQNSLFFDNGNKLASMQNLFVQVVDPNGVPTTSYYPDFGFPKVFTFDFTTEEFELRNVGFMGDPDVYHDTPVLPWNPDGEGQQHNDDGLVIMEYGWPIYHHDVDAAFHENKHKLAINDDNGWIAAVWHEGIKNKLAFEGIAGYEDWAEVPELAIAISNDNGETWYLEETGDWLDEWYNTIYLSSNADPELDGMIPVYAYPADYIEDLGNGWGRLHFMFMDDNSFGSFIQGHGSNLGGQMMYTSVDIWFDPDVSADDVTIPVADLSLKNYPNPFNPETTISYSLQEASDVSVEVYNIRGQKVKTLVDNEQKQPGTHSVTWNGTDQSGRTVASGVYLYRVDADGGRYTSTRKMILLK
jgi:hypothetical protein